MISGPLSSLPPDLESRLAAARNKTPGSTNSVNTGVTADPGPPGVSGQANGHSPKPRPSDIMVAAVTARTNGAKTPGHSQVKTHWSQIGFILLLFIK